jgi:hypothetical protein
MYTLLVTGDVPGAATYFNPLLQQTIIPCTSGTRPSSPPDGMLIWETDTERYKSWNATLSEWVTSGQMLTGTITPSITSSGGGVSLGSTGNSAYGRYTVFGGKFCTYIGQVTWGTIGQGPGSGQYFLTLPFTASNAAPILTTGSAMIRDNSASTVQPAVCYVGANSTTLSITSSSGIVGSATPWAWGANDYIAWSLTYEIS